MAALVSGDPKPVTIECPLDLWLAPGGPVTAEARFPEVDLDAIDRAADLLAKAQRPLILVGGGAHAAAEPLQAPLSSGWARRSLRFVRARGPTMNACPWLSRARSGISSGPRRMWSWASAPGSSGPR